MFSFLRRKGPIFLGDPSFLETHFTKMPKKKIVFFCNKGLLKKMFQTQMTGRNNSQSLKLDPWCEDVESKKNIRRKETNKIKSLNMEFVVFLFGFFPAIILLAPYSQESEKWRMFVAPSLQWERFGTLISDLAIQAVKTVCIVKPDGRKDESGTLFFLMDESLEGSLITEDLRMIPKNHFVCLSLDFSLWNSVGA